MKFGPKYPGMGVVNWVKQVGSVKHPEWYPDLPYPASDWQIANMLYTHGTKGVPRPCKKDEEEGHFVPVADSPVFADSEGWLTSTTVTSTTKTMTTMTIPPLVTIPPPGKPSTQSSNSTTPALPGTTIAGLASTGRPTQSPIPTAAATTTEAQVQENTCFKSGKSLTPLDAVGYTAVSTDTIEGCQAHCKSVKSEDDIGHFLYYKPLRTCHCPPMAASEAPVGPEFVSGPLSCDIALSVLADSSTEIFRSPSVGFRVPAMIVGTFLAVAVVGAAAVALRRRPQNNAAHLDEESGGLEFLRTWPDTGSAVE